MSVVEEAPVPRVAPQPPVVSNEVRDVLRKAKELLLIEGWSSWGSGGIGSAGPHCLGLAICKAKSEFSTPDEYEALGFGRDFTTPMRVFRWNDHECGSLDNAVARIDRALGA